MIVDCRDKDIRFENQQLDLCKAAYRYVDALMTFFTEDCVLLALNGTMSKAMYHKALQQMIEDGEAKLVRTLQDGTPLYSLRMSDVGEINTTNNL